MSEERQIKFKYVFADNYFSLLPGEVRTIEMRPADNAESKEFTVTGYTIRL